MTETREKGKRRLERSYRTKDIESTDNEAGLPSRAPSVLSDKLLKKALKDVPSMMSSAHEREAQSGRDKLDLKDNEKKRQKTRHGNPRCTYSKFNIFNEKFPRIFYS